MSLFGAMTASVSGLNAQGQAISVISDNLSNTNTIGYKASRSLFSQLVTSAGSSGTAYNSGGVGTNVQRMQNSQGSFISSSSKTDLAISGNGFFRVADNSVNGTNTNYYYTRAGSFSEDKQGFLVNPDGFYLQGWRTDSNGNILNVQNLQAVELQSVGVSAQATTTLALDANLTSTEELNSIYAGGGTLNSILDSVLADPTRADYVTDIRVYDAQGGARDLSIAFTKRAANLWDWQIYTDGSNVQGGAPTATAPNARIGGGTVEFNTNGSLKNVTGANLTNILWSGGVNPGSINLNFGEFTGGNVVTATSASLGYETTGNTPMVTANTIPNVAAFNAAGAGAPLTSSPATTYTLRRVDATTIAIYDAANGAQVEAGIAATATGAQTLTFPSGLSIQLAGGFDMTAVADGAAIGTFTLGEGGLGDVRNIASEDPTTLPAGATYTIRTNAGGQLELVNAGGTVLDTAPIGATGTREVYFSTARVRMTVGNAFAVPGGPTVIGTFTVSPQSALNEGLGTDGVTQLAANYDTNSVNQNGFGAGTIASISVDEYGFVSGTFTNGENKKLYKIAIAAFQNPGGLEAVSGSLLRPTDASGNALMKEASTGSTGRLVSGSLEGSTTDIAGEFSNMIVAQRAFQASSKVITTVDQMLNELLQLR